VPEGVRREGGLFVTDQRIAVRAAD